MSETAASKVGIGHGRAWAVLASAAVLVLAACGSSGTTKAASGGVTISSATVPGVGSVLVNGSDGKTLYLLTADQGGKITCTDDSGCTKVWPDTELPSGVTAAKAGQGVDASKLSTVKSADGHLYPTYAGWPLYEYAGDAGSGQAAGQGIVSFGGTWETLTPAGTPVTLATGATAGGTPTTAYGY
jgi:predicted lipoprotein with Yx(FWY)xxD motif